MELSPQAISAVEFDLVRRGYDPDQVRQFLQRLAAAIEEMRSHLVASDARARAAMARVQELSASPHQAPAPQPASDTEAISKALLLAQRMSDEVVAEAQAKADAMVAEAQNQAGAVMAAAEARALEKALHSEHEARTRLSSEVSVLAERKAILQAESDVLRSQIAEMHQQIGTSINELQKVLVASRKPRPALDAPEQHAALPSPPVSAPLATPPVAPSEPTAASNGNGSTNGSTTGSTNGSTNGASNGTANGAANGAAPLHLKVTRMAPSLEEMANGASVLDGVADVWRQPEDA
jgi:DivIVA domain-containing protein